MGNVKIRYYVTHQHPGRPKYGYWAPCLKRGGKPTLMAKLGFKVIDCGEDGPLAWAKAQLWNARWDEARKKFEATGQADNPSKIEIVYPRDSLGEAFTRFRATKGWQEKKPRTREDWERGWAHIGPIFGDVDPSTVSLEDMDLWYWGRDSENEKIQGLIDRAGVREAHRAMKIWRALWVVISSMANSRGEKYCKKAEDPSLGIRRRTPKPRNAIWYEGEAVRLVKRSLRMGYYGLAAALAVAWDTMLSPVDVRSLTLSQLKGDNTGPLFTVDRTKTGRSAIGTLSPRTSRLLDWYIGSMPFTLHPDRPIFHTRGMVPGKKGGKPRPPAPYTKDSLGDDFRDVRAVEFPGETRKISDFRRSGAVEATAGEVDQNALAGKMANSIDSNRHLQQTYQPHTASIVRMADAARLTGRGRLRGNEGGKQ